MKKGKNKSNSLPKVYFGSGERCVGKAVELVVKEKNVALFMTKANRPHHWSITSNGIYATCDADLETDDGLALAVEFVGNQRFDALMFATHADEPEDDEDELPPRFLTYGRNHVEIIKAAAFAAISMTGLLTLLE